jgi:predicted AlkP superfamily phosphohydrolase/phosphomutase
MDEVLGEALTALDEHTTLVAISDHGFAPFHRCFHLNSWLLENGYLALKPGIRRSEVAYLSGIDWRRTRAYALGINGLYLNRRGREREGVVSRGTESEQLLRELVMQLEALQDPETGRRPVKHAYRADVVYTGPHAADGPDIVVGYERGYRGSNESALGRLPEVIFADNLLKWSGDHCMAADEVPGIIVSNRELQKSDPSLLDMAPTFLGIFGLRPAPDMIGGDLFARTKSV